MGIILNDEFVRNIQEVKRVSDTMLWVKLESEGEILKVTYAMLAPQKGCTIEQRENFPHALDDPDDDHTKKRRGCLSVHISMDMLTIETKKTR